MTAPEQPERWLSKIAPAAAELPEPVWRWVLICEGREVNHPEDLGGRTDYGIAQHFHPQEWADGQVTEAEARGVYTRDYWQAGRCHELPLLQGLLLFDLLIQHPPAAAAKLWQQILGGIKVDGTIGPKTVAAAQAAHPPRLVERYFPRRAVHYLDIARANTSQLAFIQGWMGRLFKLQRYLCHLNG